MLAVEMRIASLSMAALLCSGACSKSKPAPSASGRIVVAMTVDWEGAYISPEGLDNLAALRKQLGTAPLTHFVSAGYFTKTPSIAGPALAAIGQAIRPTDELDVHVHGWKSLAVASGITPKLTVSFLTGDDKLMEMEDGDVGFDLDLDVYEVPELKALLHTSRTLLEQTKHPIGHAFRAGGYLATRKVRQALVEEGFTIDSSATDYHQIADDRDDVLAGRIHSVWPDITDNSQPFPLEDTGGKVLEMPIAAFTDYAKADELLAIFDAARARLKANPNQDVFVTIGLHQETGADTAKELPGVLTKVLAGDMHDRLLFTTLEDAAARARKVTPPRP